METSSVVPQKVGSTPERTASALDRRLPLQTHGGAELPPAGSRASRLGPAPQHDQSAANGGESDPHSGGRDQGEWPGFRADGLNVWEHAKLPGVRPGGLKSQTVRALAERDPSFPRSVLNREKAPHAQARQALSAIAKRRRQQHKSDSLATKQQLQNRELLADGVTNAMVNHHIVAQALRFVPGGRDTFTGLVHRAMLNGDPDAKAWWSVYADLPLQHQARIDFDDVCGVAGVQPDRIMGTVVSTAMRVGNDVGDLVAATMHPSIVHRTTKSALRIGGEHAAIAQKDREMLFQHARFVPIPRGVTITAHASAQAAAAAANQPSVPTFAESLDDGVNAHRDVQREFASQVVDGETD